MEREWSLAGLDAAVGKRVMKMGTRARTRQSQFYIFSSHVHTSVSFLPDFPIPFMFFPAYYQEHCSALRRQPNQISHWYYSFLRHFFAVIAIHVFCCLSMKFFLLCSFIFSFFDNGKYMHWFCNIFEIIVTIARDVTYASIPVLPKDLLNIKKKLCSTKGSTRKPWFYLTQGVPFSLPDHLLCMSRTGRMKMRQTVVWFVHCCPSKYIFY